MYVTAMGKLKAEEMHDNYLGELVPNFKKEDRKKLFDDLKKRSGMMKVQSRVVTEDDLFNGAKL